MKFSNFKLEEKKFVINIDSEGIRVLEFNSINQLVDSSMLKFIQEVESFRVLHNKIKEETKITSKKKIIFNVLDVTLKIAIVGFFYKTVANKAKSYNLYMNILSDLENKCRVSLKHEIQDPIKNEHKVLLKEFDKMSKSDAVWDITNEEWHDGKSDRSGVSYVTERSDAFFEKSHLWYIDSDIESMFFYNANGRDFFIYPSFMITDTDKKFKFVSMSNLNVLCKQTKFLESESVPDDAEIVGYSWKYVNNNGTQDKRFKDNVQISVTRYAELELSVEKMNFNERYLISNFKSANRFVEAFEKYKNLID